MRNRLRSAIALLLILGATVALDHALDVEWFSALLIAVVVSMGAWECDALFRLRRRLRSPEAAPDLLDVVGPALLAVVCVVLPGAFLLALRLQEHGLLPLLYLIAVAKMVDNGALFVGTLWGRHKLAPEISPAKTVEGVCGGLFTGIASAVLLGPLCVGGRFLFFMIFGLTIGLLSILGDLAESLLKRRAGVKDSASLFPGIGGVLDLMDSILLSAPVGYFLLAP